MPNKKQVEDSEEVTEIDDALVSEEEDINSEVENNSDNESTDNSSTEEEEEEEDNETSDIIEYDTTEKENYENRKTQRISKPYLNKYEKTRILATRSKQLSLGAKPLIKIISDKKLSPFEIAIEELKQKMIPYIIRRKMPDGKYELWRVDELEDIYQTKIRM